jgi:hypothetical protein
MHNIYNSRRLEIVSVDLKYTLEWWLLWYLHISTLIPITSRCNGETMPIRSYFHGVFHAALSLVVRYNVLSAHWNILAHECPFAPKLEGLYVPHQKKFLGWQDSVRCTEQTKLQIYYIQPSLLRLDSLHPIDHHRDCLKRKGSKILQHRNAIFRGCGTLLNTLLAVGDKWSHWCSNLARGGRKYFTGCFAHLIRSCDILRHTGRQLSDERVCLSPVYPRVRALCH